MMRALRWLGYLALGAATFVLVFWLTFPSGAIVNRIRHEVRGASDGDHDLRLASVAPRWLGLAAADIVAYRRAGDAVEPFLGMDALSLTVAPFSLIRAPRVAASAVLESGRLDVEATLGGLRTPRPQSVFAHAEALPVEDLLAIVRGGGTDVPVQLTGALNADVDLTLGEGASKATGRVALTGDDLVLASFASPQFGELSLDAAISTLDLALRLADGVARIDRGVLRTSLMDVDIDGEIALDDRLSRSTLDLRLVVTLKDWEGTPLGTFRSLIEGQMAPAKGSDDRYHYTAKGALGRFGLNDLRPDRSRARASAPRPTTNAAPQGTPAEAPPRSAEADRAARELRVPPPRPPRSEPKDLKRPKRSLPEREALDELGYDDDDDEILDEEAPDEADVVEQFDDGY
jgi:type II secretion system protein N